MRTSLLAALTLLSFPAAAQNLLAVGDAESPTGSAWVPFGLQPGDPVCHSATDWRGDEAQLTTGTTARTGTFLFFPGCDNTPGNIYVRYQDIDVSGNTALSTGAVDYTFDGFYSGRNFTSPDQVGVQFDFIDASSNVIFTDDVLFGGNSFGTTATTNDGTQSPWAYMSKTMSVPQGTQTIRVYLMAEHNSGTDIDAYFDDLGLAEGAVALGLGLTRFDAMVTAGGAVSLQWEDSRAIKNTRYDAQWSTDGKAWTTVGQVPASRGSAYSYLHNAPARGTNYYRIAAKGLDGSVEYGATKSVSFGKDAVHSTVSVYPVPASGAVTVRGVDVSLAGTTAMLIDARGRAVRSIALGEGATLSLDGCTPGLYMLRLADGQVLRVVKE